MGLKARAGDGVVGGAGLVDGRPVFCYAQDDSYVGGSLGEAHADTIVRVLELADRARAPVVGFVGSGGARMQEGVRALGGYGRIFRQTVALSGQGPADLDHQRPLGRRRRLLAGADRLGRDDRGREHVPDRPGRRQGRDGRGRHRSRAWAATRCMSATASRTSLLRPTLTRPCWPVICSSYLPSHSRAAAADRRASRAAGAVDPSAARPGVAAAGL